MKELVIIIFFLPAAAGFTRAQNINSAAHDNHNVISEKGSVVEIVKPQKVTLYENIKQNMLTREETDFHSYIENQRLNSRKPEKKSVNLNIVASFRKNIRFGGFWQNYAIVNFTPDMFIQPFDFISIYASHNYSNYIPISSIKENIKSLALEGAAVLAVDNTIKFLLPYNHILQSLIGFAAKNIAIALVRNSFGNNNGSLLEYKHYYYAVSIRF